MADLNRIAVNGTRRKRSAIEHRDPFLGEDASEEGTADTANTVKTEDIQAFVHAEPFVQVLETGADDGGEEADETCEPDRNETCSGSDTN